ncbi:MAG: hypothetical protein A2Z46_06440 [Nitrospirae bacterium RBG_19FT_COMBO_55_12]|nr:MAG: hypothetical protein A2Z46_06440 [Nitrospirae bacterium RBG_19FT_COMBO_55_12]
MFTRFSTVAGERGAADAERDIRGFAMKFYTEEGNWDLVGNNTPVFFLRDPLKFPDLNHAVKRDPRTNLRSAISGAPRDIQLRHIGNCLKADPAYGKGVADALGIPLSELPKKA